MDLDFSYSWVLSERGEEEGVLSRNGEHPPGFRFPPAQTGQGTGIGGRRFGSLGPVRGEGPKMSSYSGPIAVGDRHEKLPGCRNADGDSYRSKTLQSRAV